MIEQPIDDGGPAMPGEQGHTPEGTWNQMADAMLAAIKAGS